VVETSANLLNHLVSFYFCRLRRGSPLFGIYAILNEFCIFLIFPHQQCFAICTWNVEHI